MTLCGCQSVFALYGALSCATVMPSIDAVPLTDSSLYLIHWLLSVQPSHSGNVRDNDVHEGARMALKSLCCVPAMWERPLLPVFSCILLLLISI